MRACLNRWLAVNAVLLASTAGSISAQAQESGEFKLGVVTSLSSTFGDEGAEARNAIQLALKLMNNKIAGREVKMSIADDAANPEMGRQATDRMIRQEGVHVVTGAISSAVVIAELPIANQAKTPLLSINPGPAEIAGKGCSAYFFNSSYQNDGQSEAIGQFAQTKGYKRLIAVAPNYPAGRDAVNGFKRFYTSTAPEAEIFTKLGQLDYSAEIAQIRSAKPEAVFIFLPGGMGVNFIKQDIQLIGPNFSFGQNILEGVGDVAVGALSTSNWNADLKNDLSKQFVDEYKKAYNKMPSNYAAQAYDGIRYLAAAAEPLTGKPLTREALTEALANFKTFNSIRGTLTFQKNHFPIQTYYLLKVVKTADGHATNETVEPILKDRGDAYAEQCNMK
jgi:branched-chain amino acid transport system substrate-binding protein